jgi:hypothetical protein
MEFNSWLTKYDDFVKIQIKTSHVNFFWNNKVICKITKTQGFHPKLDQNSRRNQKARVSWKWRKKIQGETWKCTNFNASMNFTLCFSVSLSCALVVGFSSLVCLDKTTASSMSEKCFKLRMWSVEFLSEQQLLWVRNAWSYKCEGSNCKCEV